MHKGKRLKFKPKKVKISQRNYGSYDDGLFSLEF
ncbi:hypothetical protein V6Z12_D09G111500 [Gossypium hirsutum]